MEYFTHPAALVETGKIGKDSRVWAFTHILAGARIGADCNICDHVFIENEVTVGDRVTIKSGVQLWDGITVEDDVFIGPNVTFTNDLFPRSKRYPDQFQKTVIRKGASIGANATILAGHVIGKNAMVGAGAVVVRDVPPNAIVTGNPGRISGYVSSITSRSSANTGSRGSVPQGTSESAVAGVSIYRLPLVSDLRGSLSFAEYGQYLPFLPKRYFLVFDVPSTEVRGEHAHRKLHQFLVCVHGCCAVVVDDSKNREEILLDTPCIGIHIPPLVWSVQYKYTADAVLLVMGSDTYDPNEYIRDYDEFLEVIGSR